MISPFFPFTITPSSNLDQDIVNFFSSFRQHHENEIKTNDAVSRRGQNVYQRSQTQKMYTTI